MEFDRLLRAMEEHEASDLFLKVGNKPFLRMSGKLIPIGDNSLNQEEIKAITGQLMGSQQRQTFHAYRELNFAFEREGIGRFRANALWDKGSMALVIRRVNARIPSFEELNLPADVLSKMMREQHGLILITGPTDCGKSTTIASMLEYVNQLEPKHIVTLEDPIEYQFEELRCIITQREVGDDTRSFSEGLRNVLRQSPDVLYVSDIRDRETMEAGLLAAEAGQLVLSCIHTTNAVTTIERLVAFFPPHQQTLIRLRLSLALRGTVSLRLLKRVDGSGRIPAFEVMVASPTIRELVRDGRSGELQAIIQNGGMYGMQTFTQSLYRLYQEGKVDLEEALRYADHPEELQLAVRDIRPARDVN